MYRFFRAASRRITSSLCAFVVMSVLALLLAPRVNAQPVGRASNDFPNLRSNKSETPFGRLVADSILAQSGADAAFINAGALKSGTLTAGPIESGDLETLLAFSDDDIATLSLSGAQIRAALERAAGVFPTGSPAFLQCAGLSAHFDAGKSSGKRIVDVRVRGKALDDGATYSVAMPASLAEGAAGYFNIWNGAQKRAAGANLIGSLSTYIRTKGEVAPDDNARFSAV